MKPHRIWFKVLLNPILRRVGFSIVSVFRGSKLIGYRIKRYPKYCKVINERANTR